MFLLSTLHLKNFGVFSFRTAAAFPAQTEITDEQLHAIHNVTDIDKKLVDGLSVHPPSSCFILPAKRSDVDYFFHQNWKESYP